VKGLFPASLLMKFERARIHPFEADLTDDNHQLMGTFTGLSG
jgi:hypothetical protein